MTGPTSGSARRPDIDLQRDMPAEIAILFWCYTDLPLCKERARLLRRFNPQASWKNFLLPCRHWIMNQPPLKLPKFLQTMRCKLWARP